MPRGVSIYDRAILQRRLWSPPSGDALAGAWNIVVPGGWTHSGSTLTVPDISGRGRTLTAAGVATAPTANRPFVMNGSSHVLANTSTGIGAVEDVTLVMIASPRSNNGGYDGFFTATTSTTTNDYQDGIALDQGNASTTSLSYISIEGGKCPNNIDCMDGDIAFGAPVILTMTAATATAGLRVNGGAFGTTRSTSSSTINMGLIGFGARRYANAWFSTTYAAIDFYGAALFTRQLQTWEIERAEGWLAWATGTQSSLRANHPFYNRPPLIGD